MATDDQALLRSVGPRLRAVREEHGTTLAQLSEATDISTSTLSRLESGERRPTLELLLPIARAHQLPLEDLVGTLTTPDPRVRQRPRHHAGRISVPLTRRPGGMKAYKMQLPFEPPGELRSHEGSDWIYVLAGRLRLRLADLDLDLGPGEVAEFDCHTPHWFASADPGSVEVLVLVNASGERLHIRSSG